MMRFFSILLVTTVIFAGSFSVGTAIAQENQRFFPETQHVVRGPFYDFWSMNGDLAVFGLPISSQFVESGLTVQYFERAVFELHADLANTPYHVQLRNLGSFLASDRQFLTIQSFESLPAVWFFPESGHSLAYGFLKFWREHDGLRNFGYPISEEVQENGFTVQYFERARFEYHPDFAGTPYEVELGLLGAQYAMVNVIPEEARAPETLASGSQVSNDNGLVQLGWWGQITSPVINARSGPSTNSFIVGAFYQGMTVKVLKEVQGDAFTAGNSVWYQIDGGRYPGAYIYSGFVKRMDQPTPPANFRAPSGIAAREAWVDVDLTRRILTLFEGNKPVFATYVAIGTQVNPTVIGQFRIWVKLRYTDMVGRPPVVAHAYDLKNVPWVQYFYNGWALHGTYWHDNFTEQRSAGCVNLTIGDAEYIFNRTQPVLPPGQPRVTPTLSSPGTVVVTHW